MHTCYKSNQVMQQNVKISDVMSFDEISSILMTLSSQQHHSTKHRTWFRTVISFSFFSLFFRGHEYIYKNGTYSVTIFDQQ